MVELLAPAGDRDAFIAAIEGGADAVYLGGKMFGARQYAANFDEQAMADAVRYAHLYGVMVFVTVNTLIDDSEIPSLVSYLRQLYEIGVDAIIVQDIGVAKIAEAVIPHMAIHASTQMTTHNLTGVNFLRDLGFNRVVLARELSLDDIKYICQHSNLEIETFIHGALCISYSGQCLMSSMIGGRSGNRGRCAQPCRLTYTLVDKTGSNVLKNAEVGEYLLSPKDLNTLEMIPELIAAGVASFKIEGRMKRPEYVAIVTHTYRQAIDAYIGDQVGKIDSATLHNSLARSFNRGFTAAYLKGRPGRFMMSDRRPNNRGTYIGRVIDYNPQEKVARIKLESSLQQGDIVEFWVKVGGRVNVEISLLIVGKEQVTYAPQGAIAGIPVHMPVRANDRVFKTYDSELSQYARSFFQGNAGRRIAIDVKVEVSEGNPLSITICDTDGYTGQGKTDFLAQKALKHPLTAETIVKQINRLGSTIFMIRDISFSIHGEVMVPISEINEARRQAIEELEKSRLKKYARPPLADDSYALERLLPAIQTANRIELKSPALVVNVDTLEKVSVAVKNGADIVMVGGECFDAAIPHADDFRKAVDLVKSSAKKIVLNTPRIVHERQIPELKASIELYRELKPDAISIANLGVLPLLNELGDIPLHGDYPLNIYNSVTVKFFAERGFSSLTLSPELNFEQLSQLIKPGEGLELECLIHGYLSLMISEFCMLGSYAGNLHTGKCARPCRSGEYWLKDRKNELFRVVTDQYCRMHILNAKELHMLAHIPRFSKIGIRRVRIEGKDMTVNHLEKIVRAYRQALDLVNDESALQDLISATEHSNITRGHYFRGVL